LLKSLNANLIELIACDIQFISKVLLVLFSELVRPLELSAEVGRELTFRFSLTSILRTDELSIGSHPFLPCESKTVCELLDGSTTQPDPNRRLDRSSGVFDTMASH
jgi:hypothetical protein